MAPRRTKSGQEARRIELLRKVLEGRMPAGQAEEAAQAMWRTWGSLSGIATAPLEALAAVRGMDKDSAQQLRLTLELARALLSEQSDGIKVMNNIKTAVELFKPMFLGLRAEAVGALLLDAGKKVIYSGIVCNGAVSAVPLYIRGLVRLCIDYNADSLLLAHNHVSGSLWPSKQDIVTTQQLSMALEGIQIQLADHIILTDKGSFSFSESGLLPKMYSEAMAARRMGRIMAHDLADDLEEFGWDSVNTEDNEGSI